MIDKIKETTARIAVVLVVPYWLMGVIYFTVKGYRGLSEVYPGDELSVIAGSVIVFFSAVVAGAVTMSVPLIVLAFVLMPLEPLIEDIWEWYEESVIDEVACFIEYHIDNEVLYKVLVYGAYALCYSPILIAWLLAVVGPPWAVYNYIYVW